MNMTRIRHEADSSMRAMVYAVIMMALFAILGFLNLGCQTVKTLDKQYDGWVESGGISNSIAAYVRDVLLREVETNILVEAIPSVVYQFTDGFVEQSNTDADATDYAAFKWIYGGWVGKNCQWDASQPRIQNLAFNKTGLSYSWFVNESSGKKMDLSIWGLAYTDASAICCLFVQRSDGTWVGGKFDWISSSRLTRGFKEHVVESNGKTYKGWSLDGVPNPCQAAFVICNKDGSRRSNVLVGTWNR